MIIYIIHLFIFSFLILNKELNYPFYFSSISITLIFKKGYIAKIYPFVYFVINYYYILSLLITSTISWLLIDFLANNVLINVITYTIIILIIRAI